MTFNTKINLSNDKIFQPTGETLTLSENTTFCGNVQIPSGASDGYVLTSDVDGNASWQEASGGVDISGYTCSANGAISIGYGALPYESGITENIALGTSTLSNLISGGSCNIAIGCKSLCLNSTGDYNIGLGIDVLSNNVSGYGNLGIGLYSLNGNFSGNNNIGIGSQALSSNYSGCSNVALGHLSMSNASGGSYNISLGTLSLYNNCEGNDNIALGCRSLTYNTVGGCNVAIGRNSLCCNINGTDNVAIGQNSLGCNVSGRYNISIGPNSSVKNTGACDNISLGRASLFSNISGNANVGIGLSTLYCNTGGTNNVGIGFNSLYRNISGADNVSIGTNSSINNDGNDNIVLGRESLFSALNSTSNCNVAIGSRVLHNNCNGHYNVAIGSDSMYFNCSGHDNIGIGKQSLWCNTTGILNIGIGVSALFSATTTSCSIGIGYDAGRNANGDGNVMIGFCAGYNETNSNRLHIANNGTSSLIYGEFDNKLVCIDEKLSTCQIQITSGASEGYLLTSDSGGTATWQPPMTYYKKVSVSSAEILALNTTPKELIAAPGAGKFILLNKFIFYLNYGTSAYSGTGTAVFVIYNGAAIWSSGGEILGRTQDYILVVDEIESNNASDVINKSLDIRSFDSNPTGGDGTLDVHLWYSIVTI